MNAATYNGSEHGDHLAVISSDASPDRFVGAYFMNKPTPSGSPRLLLQWSTKLSYATDSEAADAIENIFQAMPKIPR